MSTTVEEWREARMPHFTACEGALRVFFEGELRRVGKLLGFARDMFVYSWRVKEAKSAARTADRLGIDFWNLEDWLGLRLACPTLESAYHLSVAVNQFDGWQSVARHDYNARPEVDGYRGIHLCGRVGRSLTPSTAPLEINCELQLHTRLQSMWAEMTHDEIYKPARVVPLFAHDTAVNLAAYMAATDQLFERTLKVLRDPGSQLQPMGTAEVRHWISVLATLDHDLDWYGMEPLIGELRVSGLNEGAQLDALLGRYGALREVIRKVRGDRQLASASSVADIALAARLVVEKVRDGDVARKLADWLDTSDDHDS